MPELAEIKIMAEFLNSYSDKILYLTPRSPVGFANFDSLYGLPFKISADSRGKELKLDINVDYKGKFKNFFDSPAPSYYFMMGMTGNWMLAPKTDKVPHTRLSFDIDGEDNKLVLTDVRKFVKIRIDTQWSSKRGPCPVNEYDEFKAHVKNNLTKFKKDTIAELLLNQKYFNGIGNYLRAEILYKANIIPWANAYDVLNDTKSFNKIIKLCKDMPMEVYNLGGGQIKNWKNPYQKDPQLFADWQQVYRKGKSYEDKKGRTVWYDPKLNINSITQNEN